MTNWPDIEVVTIAWLRERGLDARAELDNDLLAELPVVQVTRATGDDDGLRLDRALVDIDVYAATRAAAFALSGSIRGLLLNELRGSTEGTAVIGMVRTISAPSWRPYENVGLRRSGATYEIFFHPVS